MPFLAVYFFAWMRFAFSQANTNADNITPTKTANARLCSNTVMAATNIPTKISCLGILPIMLMIAHSKVPTATITITPVKAAMSSRSINEEPYMIKTKSITDATMPESLALAPDEILIKL